MLAADRTVHHMVARAVPLPRADGSHELVGMISDVTREREAEFALTRSLADRERLHRAVAAEKRLLERLADCVPAAIVMVAPRGRLVFSNPQAAAVLGEALEKLEADVERRLASAEGSADRCAAEVVATVLRTGQACLGREVDCPSVAGARPAALVASAVPVVDGSGTIEAVVASFHDVTASRNLRERLQHFSRLLLAAQDDERRRVARDLHDDLGQVLTALKISVAALAPGADPSQRAKVAAALASVDRSIQYTRDLSLALHPPMLDILGLGATLPWYLKNRLEGTSVEAESAVGIGEARFPAEVETTCFRVLQEGLTNVLRHARARRVFVALRRQSDDLVMVLRDDGCGFDVAEVWDQAGLGRSTGLTGMQERVAFAAGSFEVRSEPGAGAEIRATFPLKVPW
jgi:signal transduction histidine kinase